jgi:hypothetical protein
MSGLAVGLPANCIWDTVEAVETDYLGSHAVTLPSFLLGSIYKYCSTPYSSEEDKRINSHLYHTFYLSALTRDTPTIQLVTHTADAVLPIIVSPGSDDALGSLSPQFQSRE